MPDGEQNRIDGARRDRREFEKLFAEYRARLFALCLRQLGSREDAEDAVLETSLRAYQSLAHFRGDCTLYTWLCRIATHACIDTARRRKPVFSLDDHAGAEIRDTRPTPEQEVVGPPILAEVLERAQQTKPPWDALDYLIFGRHYGDGMELKEIARELGKPEGTIRGRVHDRIKPVFEWLRQEKGGMISTPTNAGVGSSRLRVEESADHA